MVPFCRFFNINKERINEEDFNDLRQNILHDDQKKLFHFTDFLDMRTLDNNLKATVKVFHSIEGNTLLLHLVLLRYFPASICQNCMKQRYVLY